MGLLARREVSGLENFPRTGPCIVVFNQLSVFDTPLVNTLVPRPDVTGLVAHDYRRNYFYRALIQAGGGMWIHRNSPDRSALRAALQALQRGWVVEISPEGRRSPTGALVFAKPGPAFLATRTGVPVVPIAGPDRRRRLREAADEVLCRVAALLPPRYRGVYADHPLVTTRHLVGRPRGGSSIEPAHLVARGARATGRALLVGRRRLPRLPLRPLGARSPAERPRLSAGQRDPGLSSDDTGHDSHHRAPRSGTGAGRPRHAVAQRRRRITGAGASPADEGRSRRPPVRESHGSGRGRRVHAPARSASARGLCAVVHGARLPRPSGERRDEARLERLRARSD